MFGLALSLEESNNILFRGNYAFYKVVLSESRYGFHMYSSQRIYYNRLCVRQCIDDYVDSSACCHIGIIKEF